MTRAFHAAVPAAILHSPVPPDILHNLGATSVAPVPTLLIGGMTALYLLGAARVRAVTPSSPWPARRTSAFIAAMAVTFVAIELAIGVYDDVLFYDHMVQHLLLVMIAGPLIAMGAPLELMRAATTGWAARAVASILDSKIAGIVLHPLTGFVLYGVLIPVSHLTSLYNFTLENEAAHDLEHVAFLVVGYLFWRQVVAIEPSPRPIGPGVRLLFLAFAVPVDTFTGLALMSTAHEVFPAYLTFHRSWGPQLVTDLRMGGAIMWIGGDSLMGLAMAPVLVQWMHSEEARAVQIDAELDAETDRELEGEMNREVGAGE